MLILLGLLTSPIWVPLAAVAAVPLAALGVGLAMHIS